MLLTWGTEDTRAKFSAGSSYSDAHVQASGSYCTGLSLLQEVSLPIAFLSGGMLNTR